MCLKVGEAGVGQRAGWGEYDSTDELEGRNGGDRAREEGLEKKDSE